jgi:hypothetical protein
VKACPGLGLRRLPPPSRYRAAGYCLPGSENRRLSQLYKISELNPHGLLSHCIRFGACQSPGKRQCSFPACPLRLWRGGTCTPWVSIESFTVSSTVPLSPRFSQRDHWPLLRERGIRTCPWAGAFQQHPPLTISGEHRHERAVDQALVPPARSKVKCNSVVAYGHRAGDVSFSPVRTNSSSPASAAL